MKIGKGNVPAVFKGLSFAVVILLLAGISVRAWSDDTPGSGTKAPMSTGGFVDDPAANVPTNAYVTFSTVYNGRRYYLGVDTVLAKSGKDTVAYYEGPSYATMWIAGPMWSPTGAALANKDYTRTVKSVWLEERVSRERYLALGAGSGTYSTLRLLAEGTMWHTTKDDREQNKYINGFLYYYSNATGIDVYRYLRYDPVYGFSRLYETKPANSQRISVWDRKTGSDLIYHMTPSTISFGYDVTHDTVKQAITSQVTYYESVDRFRSRYDHVDIFASRSEPITDQETLIADPYNLVGHFEWKSNPIDEAHLDLYDGHSKMQYYTITGYDTSDPANPVAIWGWADTTMVWARKNGFRLRDNVWYDTIYAIGKSPIDDPENDIRFLRKPAGGGAPTEGDYINHNDVLYTHFFCHGNEYRDSVNVSRQTFHNAPYTTLTTSSSPNDHVFPYSAAGAVANPSDTAFTFTISGKYKEGNDVLSASGNVVASSVGEEMTLPIASLPCYRDTIWQVDGGGEYILDGEGKRTVDHIVLYDTLLVEALNIDGTDCDWVVATYLPARNQIRVHIQPYTPDVQVNRTAQIRYTYKYWHSRAAGDQVTDSRVIWITQEWSGAHDDELYSFNHKAPLGVNGLQAVHEKKSVVYAIPEEPLNLPLHRDHWGYYRWFNYENDKDVQYENTWLYTLGNSPKNSRGADFMPINHTTDASSRGQWDIIKDAEHPGNTYFGPDHFTKWTRTAVPAVNYPASDNKTGKIACDVSANYDVVTTAETGIGKDLTSLTEPTLGYRQIFDIQPATTRAEQLAAVRGNGNGARWLENYTIVAPAGRAFSIQPQCPIAYRGSEEIDEEHLQYIYYFNPTDDGSDPDMGSKTGIADLAKASAYNRVGKTKRTGDENYYARLITASELLALPTDSTMKVVMVNARKETAYIFGKKTGVVTPAYHGISTITSENALHDYVENTILNPNGEHTPLSGYVLVLKKVSNDEITLTHYSTSTPFSQYRTGWFGSWRWEWTDAHDYGFDKTMTVSSFTGCDDPMRIAGSNTALVKLKMKGNTTLGLADLEGYLTATVYENKGSRWSPVYEYTDSKIHVVDNDATEGSAANQAWMFYKIIDPVAFVDHFETPRWERSTNGTTWTQVAHWDYSYGGTGAGRTDVAGYTMTADGALHIEAGVHTAVNTPIFYRLRTEHFQLAKFQGLTRNVDTEMLKRGNIISEEDIERDYDIIYSLDMEHWPAPGTNNVVAYNQHFPWDFTELSYHYPLSVVPGDRRVFDTEMPGKGEYAFINKFVAPSGPTTENPGEVFECMAGAENGYMLCVNAAGKRATIMNFDFNQLTCSNQQIYLVGNYCNPVNNSYMPEITADMEGSMDGDNWTRIYRYKSGQIPYHPSTESHWYQMALPISRDSIDKYTYFRCRAEINGASQQNAHLLIDRLRFVEKARGFTIFQNKVSCQKEDSVTALIRLNFASDTLFRPGKLVAYQLQKWDKDANGGEGDYVPMTYAEVKPGYIKDGFTVAEGPRLKTSQNNDYGYVYVPERSYNPANSESVPSTHRVTLVTQAADSLVKWGLLPADQKTTRINNFKSETGNVRTFEQVISNDQIYGATPHIKSYVDEGGKWIVYIACRLAVDDTEDNTFRVGMTLMNGLNDKPTFTEDHCATFHIFKVKHLTSLRVDGNEWTNHQRAWYDGSDAAHTLLKANETYRADVQLTVDPTIQGKTTRNPRCKFDFLHANADVRPNDISGNAAFEAKYGCTRAEFVDAMETFRADDENNTIRDEYEWAKVKPSDFEWSGRTPAVATAIYNRLNKLINDGVLEIGLDYRDIYMGDRADSWSYLMPVPASGRVDLQNGNHDGSADTTIHASVCNDTLWMELHSEAPTAKLRFGYDSRVGDTYIVPTIRASRSEATSDLDVRVAHMSTADDAYAVVLGWEKTQLIGSNDPAWTGVQTFKYTQDKDMRGHAPNAFDYYTTGSVIQFTPTAENNIALKAGYWYEFRVPFYAVTKANVYTEDPAEPTGHSQFILAIAPDTVRWTPAHPDAANYWNDDNNWTPVMHNKPADGFKATVPMKDTKVIIPEVAEGLAPIVSDVVEYQRDTLHYGYEKNTCSAILFYPNAEILGQEKLTYDKAYVDVPLTTGTWQTFSPALDDVYSGDMYIPFSTSYTPANPESGASTDKEDFNPKSFPFGEGYSGAYNPRVYPFAFYQGFYNSSVPVAFYNTDEEGTPVETTMTQSTSSVDWVKSNALDMPYAPGKACVLTGYDATDADGNPLVVRLPKPEDSYCGFGKNGGTTYDAGPAVTLTRPNKLNRNLAYDQYAPSFSETDGLTYTLTNTSESEIFFFGNPTMSLVDVYRLCVANADVLKHDAGTYSFTAYNLIEDGNYIVKNITGPGQFFIAPMRAVGLIANATQTAAKTLPIKLTPSALVAITGEGTIVHSSDIRPLPRRAILTEPVNKKRLYIAASNETDWGTKKAYLTLGEQEDATRGYRFGEDALSIASGLNYYSDESFSTPLSLYTIADNEALMQDIRDTLNRVPVVFATLDDHYSFAEYTFLSFAMEGNWEKPVYLFDALTGDSIRIMDGMQIAVETPISNQLRYFINGGGIRHTEQTTDGEGIATGIDNNGGLINGDASLNDGRTRIYDVLGRQVAVLGENDLLTQLKLPTGVYVITRGNKTERVVIR